MGLTIILIAEIDINQEYIQCLLLRPKHTLAHDLLASVRIDLLDEEIKIQNQTYDVQNYIRGTEES